MKACKFYIGESTEPLSYDEMRLYLLNNPELWKSKPKKGKEDAVQIEKTNRVPVQSKARGGEEVSGTQPEAEPKSTTRKKEVKPKKEVDESESIVARLESKAGSTDEVELGAAIEEADAIIDKAVEESKRKQVAAKSNAKSANAKAKEIAQKVNEVVSKAAALLHKAYPHTKDGGDIDSIDYEDAVELLNKNGIKAVVAKPFDVEINPHRSGGVPDIRDIKGVHVEVEVDGQSYSINMANPNMGVDTAKKMPKTVEGSVSTKGFPTAKAKVPSFSQNELLDYVANRENLEQAQKAYEKAKADGDKGSMAAAEKLIKLFTEAKNQGLSRITDYLSLFSKFLTQDENKDIVDFLTNKLSYEAASEATLVNIKNRRDISVGDINNFKDYINALKKAQKYVESTIDEKIEADKQILRNYFKGLSNIGIMRDPMQEALADIKALKALIRIIKNTGIKKKEQIAQMITAKGKNVIPSFDRVFNAAINFIDQGLSDTDIDVDMLAEQYKPAPETKGASTKGYEIGKGGEGETQKRGVGKRMLDEEEEFAEFMEYNTLSDEVLSAKALAYMKDRGDSYEAVKKDVTNPNLRIPPALHMALLSNLAKYALQQARKAKTSEELVAWQGEYNELMEGIARLGTEYGQATSYLRNLFKDDAASFVSVMRDLAKRFNKGRMDKFLKTTENIVKTYHAKRKVKVDEAVNSAPVSSQVTQAYNAVKAKNTANAKKASTPQGAKEVAKKQSETNLSKSRKAAIEALKKLKVDVPKDHLYSGAIFLQTWNVAIDAAIKAVEGGFSVAEAIQKAMKAADTEAFKTGSKEDQQQYKNIVRNQIQKELEDKMQDLKKAEEDAVKEFDSLSDSEKQKVVDKIISETEFRATIQNFIKNYYNTSSGATPDSLASALLRSPEMQALGLEPAQAKNIADAVSAEIQKRLNDSVNKAIDSIVAKVAEAKYGDKPLTKEEISALKEKIAAMLKKGGNPDLNKVFEEILGMSLPTDFDYQMEKMRVMLEEAQTDTAKNAVEQRMADYIENTVKPSRLDYIEDTFFGNMLSGLSSALRNILSLFYNGAFKAMPNSFYNVYKFYEATQGKGLTQAQKWDIMVKTMPLTMYNIVGFWKGMAENAPNALDTVISGQNYDRGFGIEARRLLDRQSLDKAFPDNKPMNVLHKLLLNPVVARYMPRLLMAGDSMIFGAAEEAMTYSEAVRRAQNEAVNKLALGEIKAITTKGVLEDAKALMARTDNQIKDKVAKAEEAYKEAAEAKGLDVDSKDKRVQAQLWVLKKQVVASLIRADNKVKEDAEALERIKNYASHMTFNYMPEGTLGRLAKALNKQRNKKNLWGRLMKYFIPFVNIPINVLDQSLLQTTPYALFRFYKGTTSALGEGRQLDEYEKFEMIFMSMFSAALFANLLFLDDGEDDAIMKITGAGTGDFQKNKEFGIEPYTIRVGDTSWSYKDSRLAPMFAFIGNMRDVERYGSTVGESIGNLILNRTVRYIVDGTWWGSMASLLSIFTPTTANPYRSTTQRLAEDILRKATVPFTGQASAIRQTMNQIYELTDTDMRGITSKDKDFLGIPAAFENTLMRSTNFIPVIRDVHDKVYNSLGEPVKVKQSILPLFEAEAGESPESKKIYEIFSGKNGGVGIPQMKPLYNPNDIGAIPEPMDKHEYNEYKRIAGVNTKAELIEYGLDKLYLMDKMYKTAQSGGIEVDEEGYVTIRDAKKRAEFMSLYDKLADIDENVLENYDAYAKTNYAVKKLKSIKRRVRSAAYEKIWRERYKVPESEEMDFGDDESFEKDEEVMLERRGR